MTRYRLGYLAGAVLCAMVARGLLTRRARTPNPQKPRHRHAWRGVRKPQIPCECGGRAQSRKRGLGEALRKSANVEAKEHFAREADASGLAGFDARNLADALAGEHYENTKMYISFADEADKAGDKKVAKLFRQIAADEGDHYKQFKEAFVKLQSSSTPGAGDKEKHSRSD